LTRKERLMQGSVREGTLLPQYRKRKRREKEAIEKGSLKESTREQKTFGKTPHGGRKSEINKICPVKGKEEDCESLCLVHRKRG